MTSRSSRTRSANASRANTSRSESTPANPFDVLGPLTELPRRQLALAGYSATAFMRGAQELRRIQLESSQRVFEETVRYWQELTAAGLRMQADLVSSAGEAAAEGASEPTFESFQRAFEATMNGVAGHATAH